MNCIGNELAYATEEVLKTTLARERKKMKQDKLDAREKINK